MDTNKMREQFEAWVLREWPEQSLARFTTGEYQGFTVEHCWQAWKASREAVVVNPAWPDHYDYTNSDVAGAAVLDCRTAFQKAMKAQGLKVEVKP
ncbi:hypothetical protein QEM27_005170 [Pseudomonas putida]|nr:hypothetical protein [Pseudomonas putida]EKT8868657.1 hypothetical protein [Pseudomonas putida]